MPNRPFGLNDLLRNPSFDTGIWFQDYIRKGDKWRDYPATVRETNETWWENKNENGCISNFQKTGTAHLDKEISLN